MLCRTVKTLRFLKWQGFQSPRLGVGHDQVEVLFYCGNTENEANWG